MVDLLHTLEPYEIASKAITYARMDSFLPLPQGPLGDEVLDKLINDGIPELIARRKGFIYIATNEAWPDLYKVGCTRRSVEERMRSLNTAGLVTPWQVIRSWKVFDAPALEAKAHAGLGALRATREMFYGPLSRVEMVVERELTQGMHVIEKGIPEYWLPEGFHSEFAVISCIHESPPCQRGRLTGVKGPTSPTYPPAAKASLVAPHPYEGSQTPRLPLEGLELRDLLM